jgi:Fe2+ transport system protein B
MVILKSIVALVAGFASMAVLVILLTAFLKRRFPEWVGVPARPGAAYVAVNLAYSFMAAIAGGYVTAWIAWFNPMACVLFLAIVVLAMSGISALEARGKQPLWYQISLLAISPIGVVAGGLIRLRVMGVEWMGFSWS